MKWPLQKVRFLTPKKRTPFWRRFESITDRRKLQKPGPPKSVCKGNYLTKLKFPKLGFLTLKTLEPLAFSFFWTPFSKWDPEKTYFCRSPILETLRNLPLLGSCIFRLETLSLHRKNNISPPTRCFCIFLIDSKKRVSKTWSHPKDVTQKWTKLLQRYQLDAKTKNVFTCFW